MRDIQFTTSFRYLGSAFTRMSACRASAEPEPSLPICG